ncbi:MAG: outer membrane protein assembly factor BamE [Aliivibrio sp.]|uniref:outer membrane protein assembly factor BamE domain-containing protein n=1 Tax=Aliivibrio sp. TaxID=1872443 RepID=UPI001A5B0662|nr:outer membrane protein assembly factor BamE [Aliivibrio sp.]
MRKNILRHILSVVIVASTVVGCASTTNSSNAETKTKSVETTTKVNIPEKSKFAKIEKGMSMNQVVELIGSPSDTTSYMTGKSFIPFYFGTDAARKEALYKGEGRIVFTGGTGFGFNKFKVYQIIYNPKETGYNR